ncbi:bifunctional methylenetetrahydrofolate dehydrogenase/methenyltetrahydrofolate cyclohydrolase FolD [Candidatus Sumerlaeota bacterium]|nr:bifunctional methylenetetrahydrofolate dehydrogenase/methenyltetrahydrofolate cyclohydrolase FolD [Candidatus Sumerlaeota bacterium]
MTAKIIDGKAIGAQLRADLKAEYESIKAKHPNFQPGLIVVIVGENPASKVYVNMKHKACQEIGYHSEIRRLPAESTQDEVAQLLRDLNADNRVHGILLQLPLPDHLDEQPLLELIDPRKDVDGFHPVNAGKLALGMPALAPCTPVGCQELLKYENIDPSGKFVVIVGRSNIVGKPMAMILCQKAKWANATVCIAHSRTKDLPALCRQADILIAAIGSPKFVQAEWIKPGATVIDVGTNRVEDASREKGYYLCGDVDFDAAKEVAGAITPSPGGVGPMTIACLMKNTLQAAKAIEGV